MKQIAALLAYIAILTNVAFAGKLQNEDFKTLSELTGAGGSVSQLLNTNKVYDPITNGQLSTAFSSSIVGTLLGQSKVNQASDITGTTPVANGGTGAASLTANNVLLGNGTSAVQTVAPGNNGNVLTSNGSSWVSGPASGGNGKSFLTNSGFETTPASTGYTITNSTATTETTTFVEGFQGIKLALSAQSGDLLVQSVTPNINTTGQNFEASCRVNTTLTTIQVCALANGVEQQCQAVSSAGTFGLVPIYFAAPASGTSVGVKVKATSSSTGNVFVDDCYVGQARSIGAGAPQAQLIDTVIVTGCAAAWSTTSTTFAALSTQTGCSYVSKNNICTAPSTNVAGLKCSSLPSGDYRIEYEGGIFESVANKNAWFQFTDGTQTANEQSSLFATTAGVGVYVNGISQSFSYSTPKSNVTWQIFGKVDTSGNAGVYGQNANPGVFKIWYFPNQSQQVLNAQTSPVSWSGAIQSCAANPTVTSGVFADFSLPSSCAVTSYGSPINFGTVSVGSSGTSISFTPPKTGRYLVINSASYSVSSTGSSAQLALADGNNNYYDYGAVYPNSSGIYSSVTLSGIVNITSLSSPTVMKVRGSSSLTITQERLSTSQSSGWKIIALDQSLPSPYTPGNITSNSSGSERIERFRVDSSCTSTPCTISSQSGSWLTSITRTAVGKYTLNYPSTTWSSAPTCSFTFGTTVQSRLGGVPSTTSTLLETYNSSFSATDTEFYGICMGPR